LQWEKLARYPVDDRQVAPTVLGNAIRAFETYGLNRFGLDSQSFWTELQTLAPKSLQDELDNSRAATDFFVCTFYLAALYGLAAFALGWLKLHGTHPMFDVPLIAQGVGVLILGPVLCYRMAVTSTSYWSGTVKAMVNLGRFPLAQSLGLTMPATLDRERAMWTALTQLVFFPFDAKYAHEIDQYRSSNQKTESAGSYLARQV